MKKIIAINTSRLLIVPFSERHLTARYVSWLNDKVVTRYSAQRHRAHSLASCREYLKAFRRTSNLFWALEARDKNVGHIGNITAHIDHANSIADVGILIGEKSVWGMGYGLEAFQAVCRALLSIYGFRKVSAGTMKTNVGMRKIMRRTGMKSDGYRSRQYVVDGQEVDAVYGALFSTNSTHRQSPGDFSS